MKPRLSAADRQNPKLDQPRCRADFDSSSPEGLLRN